MGHGISWGLRLNRIRQECPISSCKPAEIWQWWKIQPSYGSDSKSVFFITHVISPIKCHKYLSDYFRLFANINTYVVSKEIQTQGGQTGLHTSCGNAPIVRLIQSHTRANLQELPQSHKSHSWAGNTTNIKSAHAKDLLYIY